MIRPIPLVALLLLAACDPAPPPGPPGGDAAPLPRELCAKVKEGLDALRARGAVDYRENGEASIAEAAWFAMGPASRDQFAQLLGFHAACALPDGAAEQQIVVRNEGGLVLMRRTVETRVDLSEALGQDDAP